MEEKNNMTAERSLEIIRESIEQSRKAVSADAGTTLLISGLCIVGVATVVAVGHLLTKSWVFYLLYMLIPIFIWAIDRYVKRNKPKVPASVISRLVDKTWQTFGIFVTIFFVLSILYNNLMLNDALSLDSMQTYFQNRIEPVRIILLMMGMAVTINGYILKSKWMVWCGIIGGLGGYFWQAFCVTETLAANTNMGALYVIIPNLMIAVFTFIGLTLPGWMLVRNKK